MSHQSFVLLCVCDNTQEMENIDYMEKHIPSGSGPAMHLENLINKLEANANNYWKYFYSNNRFPEIRKKKPYKYAPAIGSSLKKLITLKP